MMRKALTLLSFAVSGLLLAASPVAADEPKDVLIMLSTEEDQPQGLAMSMASELAQENHNVRIVLCGDAGDLGLEEYMPQALAPRDISAKELMQEAMSFGAEVEVCHLYLPNSGYRQYEEQDLMDQVTVNNPAELAQLLAEDDIRVISF